MMDSATYLVSKEIAQRSGLIDSRYRIADGRFVLNDRDLARVRFTTDEYINGLQGVEKVASSQAKTLIAQNNYQIGQGGSVVEETTQESQQVEVETTVNEDVVENTEEETEKENENNETTEE